MKKYPIDAIYLAASSRDAKLTRICIASIRYFYPDVPLKVLPGDILQAGLAKEIKKYWNVDVVPLQKADYGWGFVKMEPLFGPKGESFLVMDVDTIFTGEVLKYREQSNALFVVDNEDHTDEDYKKLYYDWDALQQIDPEIRTARLAFSGGQWFGTAGYVERNEFNEWMDWSFPRERKYPHLFMGGEQGIVSAVIVKKEGKGELTVDRAPIMRWPGDESYISDLDLESIKNKTAPPHVIHWAGMKNLYVSKMVGADRLLFFEDYYYSRIPGKNLKRRIDNLIHIYIHVKYKFLLKLKMRVSKLLGRK